MTSFCNSAGIQPAGGNVRNKQSGPLWARFEGARSDIEANASTTGSSYDLDPWKIRVGIDGLVQENDTGLWLFGVNGYYGMANADISSATGNSQIYGLANLYYEFSGKSRVDVSGIKFINRPDQLSGEIGAGGSYNWDDNKYSLYCEISTATSLENFGKSYQFKGPAGIRVKF